MDFEFKLDLPSESGLRSGEESGQVFDTVILGGGPAGMTAAVYASRKQMKALIVSPDLGGQMLWTSGVENYLGYQYIEGPELARKFSEQMRLFPIKMAQGEKAVSARQTADGAFALETDAGRRIASRSLIVATGKRSRSLGVPGEDLYRGKGVSYCAVCDGPFFAKKPVVVVGGGNSAATAAIDMLQLESPVTMVNVAAGWQADPVLMQQLEGRAVLLDRHRVVEVMGDGRTVDGVRVAPAAGGPERRLPVSGVFVEIGLLPNTDIFRELVALNARGEIVTDCFARTSRPGVFAAGDCTSVPEKQIIIAAGDGAKAALAVYRMIKKIPD